MVQIRKFIKKSSYFLCAKFVQMAQRNLQLSEIYIKLEPNFLKTISLSPHDQFQVDLGVSRNIEIFLFLIFGLRSKWEKILKKLHWEKIWFNTTTELENGVGRDLSLLPMLLYRFEQLC